MKIELDHIYNIDCLLGMKDIPDESIDLVVTDCPYHIVEGGKATGKWKPKAMGGIYDRYNEEITENIRKGKIFKHNDIEFSEWLPEVYRVLKQDTHCYIMINARNLKDLQTEAERVGFIFQQLLVWDKMNTATPNRYYMNACEFILMLRKGGAKTINDPSMSNILKVPNMIGHKEHPTAKPVNLMEVMIRMSSNIGDVVLEPFSGSGATCLAARNLKRHFIGFEIDETYYNKSQKLLSKPIQLNLL